MTTPNNARPDGSDEGSTYRRCRGDRGSHHLGRKPPRRREHGPRVSRARGGDSCVEKGTRLTPRGGVLGEFDAVHTDSGVAGRRGGRDKRERERSRRRGACRGEFGAEGSRATAAIAFPGSDAMTPTSTKPTSRKQKTFADFSVKLVDPSPSREIVAPISPRCLAVAPKVVKTRKTTRGRDLERVRVGFRAVFKTPLRRAGRIDIRAATPPRRFACLRSLDGRLSRWFAMLSPPRTPRGSPGRFTPR